MPRPNFAPLITFNKPFDVKHRPPYLCSHQSLIRHISGAPSVGSDLLVEPTISHRHTSLTTLLQHISLSSSPSPLPLPLPPPPPPSPSPSPSHHLFTVHCSSLPLLPPPSSPPPSQHHLFTVHLFLSSPPPPLIGPHAVAV